jgi:3-oxoacyl-[acyl-carrier protein] reductase
MKLQDKVAIVTGGAQGIGKAIAKHLAEEGATVAIIDLKEEVAQATANELSESGLKAAAFGANVANGEDVAAVVKQVASDLGGVDILVNNAGITRDGLIMRMKEADWDAVLSVNLKGAFNCTKAVFRPMSKKRYGKIVNIASIVGVNGNAGQANYSASKAGMIGLTKSTAKEYASRNINVNAVAPGYIKTEMTDVLPEEATDFFLQNTPLGRAGTPDDVARVVAFLCSEDSDYVTGQVIHIDGGLVM